VKKFLTFLLPIGQQRSASGHQAEMFDHQAEKCEWGHNFVAAPHPHSKQTRTKTYLPPSAEQLTTFVGTFFQATASPMLVKNFLFPLDLALNAPQLTNLSFCLFNPCKFNYRVLY
jgi:hypothetical protein